MKKRKHIILFLRVVAYFIILSAIVYAAYSSPYNPHPTSTEDIRYWVAGFGSLAPLIYVGVYTIRPILFFPTLILNLSAGVLFGPFLGVVLVLTGGLGCATFCYILGRFGGGQWLLNNFGGSWGERLKQYLLGKDSFTKMLWLRTVPIFPYDPVSIIAGSVGLSYRIYAAATIIGMLPGAIAYNFLADSFGTGKFYGAIIVTILAFGVPLVWWKYCGAARNLSETK